MATPANWQPGDDVIIPTPGSCGVAKERVDSAAAGVKVKDWFFSMKACPKDSTSSQEWGLYRPHSFLLMCDSRGLEFSPAGARELVSWQI